MEDQQLDFGLRVVKAWERAYELERIWLESQPNIQAYDAWREIAEGYWRKEVPHAHGTLIYEVLHTDDLPGYQAQVRLMIDSVPQQAVAHYEFDTLEEAQRECISLAKEIFTEAPVDIIIPRHFFDE